MISRRSLLAAAAVLALSSPCDAFMPQGVLPTGRRGAQAHNLRMGAPPQDKGVHAARRGFLASAGALFASQVLPAGAFAKDSREVGEIPASGFVFKDVIKINAFKDPKVEGVELYISDFERPITERLQKNFFSDPTQASIGCAKVGPVKIGDIKKGKQGEEVFEQARSLLFKTLRVQRVYDEETNTLVYVSYSTRLDKGDDDNKSRYKSTTCAISAN